MRGSAYKMRIQIKCNLCNKVFFVSRKDYDAWPFKPGDILKSEDFIKTPNHYKYYKYPNTIVPAVEGEEIGPFCCFGNEAYALFGKERHTFVLLLDD